jgi:flavin reductase (DIM6/NTAB) family NADH-FMN oxidoreductase RutF
MLHDGMCASTLQERRTLTAAEFKQAGRRFASGVTVVTTRTTDDEVHGATVSAFCTLSLEPLQVMISLGSAGRLAALIRDSGRFAVSILAQDQESVSRAFADSSRPLSRDTFDDAPSRVEATGAPVLNGCLAFFDCTLERTHDSGDHTIFIGRVDAVGARDGEPLVYFDGGYRRVALDQ